MEERYFGRKDVEELGFNERDYKSEPRHIDIPYGVTRIDINAFKDIKNLKSVTIPETVVSIGDNAFRGCFGLKSITIPSSVKSIHYMAFCDCGLETVTIEEGLETINNSAFYSCESLRTINIPDSLIGIGDDVFTGCYRIENIAIKNSSDALRWYTQSKYPNLKSFTVISKDINDVNYGIITSIKQNFPIKHTEFGEINPSGNIRLTRCKLIIDRDNE